MDRIERKIVEISIGEIEKAADEQVYLRQQLMDNKPLSEEDRAEMKKYLHDIYANKLGDVADDLRALLDR